MLESNYPDERHGTRSNWILKVCFWLILSFPDATADAISPFMNRVRQVTYEGRRNGEAYFSPDGRALVFQGERLEGNPFYQIFKLDLTTGDSEMVSNGTGKTTCSFFNPAVYGGDRTEILYASTHLDPDALEKQRSELAMRAEGKERRYAWDYDETFDLFVMDSKSGLKRLTDSIGYDAEAGYSPDGNWIVFCSNRHAFPLSALSVEEKELYEKDPSYFGEIYIMKRDGSGARRLTHAPGYDGGPFFTPDGRRIVWRRFDEAGATADVYTMKTDGSDVRRITDFGAMSWAPYFHPSGEYLVFASNKEGFSNFELYMVDPEGLHQPVRVTDADGFDGLPVFSPLGDRIVWTSNRTTSKQSQIFMADWNHGAALAAVAESPWRSEEKNNLIRPGIVEAVLEPTNPDGDSKPIEWIRSDVETLASDAFTGRMTGESGEQMAATYLSKRLAQIGVNVFPENSDFIRSFEYKAGVELLADGNRLDWTRLDSNAKESAETAQLNVDFLPCSISANGEFKGGVVFAGYGLKMPGDNEEGYDSYAGLIVTNKVVLILDGAPAVEDTERRVLLNRYSRLSYKAMIARENGAKALMVVKGPRSPSPGEVAAFKSDSSTAEAGLLALSISGSVAERLLSAQGRSLNEIQEALDLDNPHVETVFPVEGVEVSLSVNLGRIGRTGRNVIGFIPPHYEFSTSEYIVLGAHYDHLGLGVEGSLQRENEVGQIHNGADDNASGVAVVLDLARRIAQLKKDDPLAVRRGVVIGFWSGEELGLIGSTRFVEKPPLGLEYVVGYLNFDMVGRLRDDKLVLQGLGSSGSWRKWIEKRNIPAGFDLSIQDDPYLPTDATSFYSKGVPVLNFFTGSHEDYHRPSDDPHTLNYEGMVRIVEFSWGILKDLMESESRPEYVEVVRSEQTQMRANLRAYLGTIPDYVYEGKGVKLSGVRPGDPGDLAGLKGGDIIVRLGEREIVNIYDYTYAIEALKIGESTPIRIQRDRKELELIIIPASR